MARLRKIPAGILVLALAAAMALATSGNAVATQTGPTLGSGDRWAYSTLTLSSNTTSALTLTVQEPSTLTIGSASYAVWHVKEMTVSPFGGSTLTSWGDVWVTADGTQIAKIVTPSVPIFGNITTVYNPPMPQAQFPLNPGDAWSGSGHATITWTSGTANTTTTWSGTVTDEQAVTVPAGTFTAAVVRSPATGTPYTLSYYSAQAGWFVRVDSYNSGGTLASVQNLTSYTDTGYGFLGVPTLVWIALLLVALAVIVVAVLLWRRRPATPYPMLQPQQPPYPPPQAPPPPGR